MIVLINSNWRESYRRWHAVSKDLSGRVAVIRVNEHARDDFMPEESLSVCQMCPGDAGVAGCVEPAALSEAGFREFFKRRGVLVVSVGASIVCDSIHEVMSKWNERTGIKWRLVPASALRTVVEGLPLIQ
jgi:hypothetical protein